MNNSDGFVIAGPSALRYTPGSQSSPTPGRRGGPRPLTLNTNLRSKIPTKHRSMSVSDHWLKSDIVNSSRHAQSLSLSNAVAGPGPSTLAQGASPTTRTPRISKLLGAVLNAPILNAVASGGSNGGNIVMVDGTFAEVSTSQTVTRPPSPAPTADFSFIMPPTPSSPMSFVHVAPPSHAPSGIYDVFTSPTSGPEGTPNCTMFISPSKAGNMSHFGNSLHSHRTKMGKATLGRLWGALSSPAKRYRGRSFNYFDGLPLDGEEGELIDEACFIEAQSLSGMDIIGHLPPEVALYIFTMLSIPAVLACRNVNRYWNLLANDSEVWRARFYEEVTAKGWHIDKWKAKRAINPDEDNNWARKRLLSYTSLNSRASINSLNSRTVPESPLSPTLMTSRSSSIVPEMMQNMAPLSLDWQRLYKTRAELDRRWDREEPKVTKIAGHEDSVYCLEFDEYKIITGSRDRTIKIWDMQTGKLRATLRAHAGSVLCIKFDNAQRGADGDGNGGPGFMVSGSSDCTVLVWDLRRLWKRSLGSGSAPISAGPELVKRVLKGHTGGVLDLRINKRWIVSCSKDGLIRVWDRKTLALTTTLRGHEGPVNAVGLQDGKVVSASGDGKMMLWDIATGERVRTFEGHERGLACIEYKGDTIISGSNDCKIKVWRASTGECVKTLVGHELLVRALSFDACTQRLVSASYDRSVKVWDLETGKIVREFKHGHESHIFDVKFDIRRIVSTSHDQKIVVLDFAHDLDTSLFL